MSVTAGIIAGVGAAGSIGGAAISSNAAGNAASTQANAADYAANLQYQEAQEALQFEQQQWEQSQINAAPWLQTGGSAELALGQLLGLPGPTGGMTPGSPFPASAGTTAFPTAPNPGVGPSGTVPGGGPGNQFRMTSLTNPATGARPVAGGSLPMPKGGPVTAMTPGAAGTPGAASTANPLGGNLQPFAPWTTPFVAPTNVTEQNDPGYQFRLNQGLGAIQNSAAGRGGLLSGNTAQALDQFAQGDASQEYANVYNRSLGQYQQNYNIYQQNQANQWNRLASLAGMGQTTAGQLNSAGLNAGSTVGNILLGSGAQIGNQLNNAAAATASGYIGGANAWSGALGGIGGNFGNLLLMKQLLGNNSPVDLSGISMDPVAGSGMGNIFAPPGAVG